MSILENAIRKVAGNVSFFNPWSLGNQIGKRVFNSPGAVPGQIDTYSDAELNNVPGHALNMSILRHRQNMARAKKAYNESIYGRAQQAAQQAGRMYSTGKKATGGMVDSAISSAKTIGSQRLAPARELLQSVRDGWNIGNR